MIKGSYIEEVFQPIGRGVFQIERKQGSWAFRDAFTFHKILVTDNQPLTLCITFPAGKNWHYMVQGQKIKWRHYLKKGKKKQF